MREVWFTRWRFWSFGSVSATAAAHRYDVVDAAPGWGTGLWPERWGLGSPISPDEARSVTRVV
ncbi:hypothetical protein [Brachybacterium sacelli]|uniref:hypothetical protein n=1 Tax=Brachybacterium sacelli TaxID=173364 RepID=UPI003607E8E5